jgi:phosphoribosylformylglycinamidine synthase
MNIGIIVFPGSNCDRDVRWATEGCLGVPTSFLWHETTDLDGFDAIVIPGGFSYGDYLRCGAIASICNGFQILTELGLLQGALTRNKNLHFICDRANLSIESTKSTWMKNYKKHDSISLPIAHGEGRYQCSSDVLKKLQDDDSVALRYADNPNGSIHDIAGITNKKGNVLGMMPHPERACDDALGDIDGKSILSTLLS